MTDAGGKDLTTKARHLRKYRIPFMGSERADQLKPFRLQQYRQNRISEGANDATVNREPSTLLHMLNQAID